MSASQVRTWGGALLAQPYGCAFFMFRYNRSTSLGPISRRPWPSWAESAGSSGPAVPEVVTAGQPAARSRDGSSVTWTDLYAG